MENMMDDMVEKMMNEKMEMVDGMMDGKNEATNPPRSMPTFIGGCVNHHAVLVFQHFIVREDKGKTFCQGPCLVRGWIFSVWQTVASSGNC